MNAVTNASPLIALAKANLLRILPEIFEHVVIPQGVANEILAGPEDDPMKCALPVTD